MNRPFSIRRMKESEVQIALDWAKNEGWNPGVNDAHTFFQADPEGFFIGVLNGEPIATGCAVTYGDQFAFCGLYIVKPEFRGKGYGIQLTEERLKYVGHRITGLDGVINKIDKYKRLGYVESHKNIRYAFNYKGPLKENSKIVDLGMVSFATLENFDRRYFPALRSQFLKSWISQPEAFALGYLDNQKLHGYGVIRKCLQGYKIGPLFAESPAIAHHLFESLCAQVSEGPIYIDIPEPNKNAQFLIKQYNMTPQFEVIRMYRNGMPDLDLEGIYGMTTYEIG